MAVYGLAICILLSCNFLVTKPSPERFYWGIPHTETSPSPHGKYQLKSYMEHFWSASDSESERRPNSLKKKITRRSGGFQDSGSNQTLDGHPETVHLELGQCAYSRTSKIPWILRRLYRYSHQCDCYRCFH